MTRTVFDQAIEAEGLVKRYGDVCALDGLDLRVAAGTVFALLGPNGAGKSTTVKILTTLSRPDAGSARVAGRDVLAEPVRVRHAIGVVGQKHGSDVQATGRENLVLQGELYALGGRDVRRRAAEQLERFGLAGAADRLVRTWSGGMRRRLDVAMGLMHRPQVLFLDEPTTGLDPEARTELWAEIERLADAEGITILLTTHYLDEADRLAARVAIADRGRVAVEGTPEALKSELRGDTIQIELADPAVDGAAAWAALERVEQAHEVQLEGRVLRARADDGGATIPAVLAALEAHGVHAASVTLARPSLDDVYLGHTGRAFAQAAPAEMAA